MHLSTFERVEDKGTPCWILTYLLTADEDLLPTELKGTLSLADSYTLGVGVVTHEVVWQVNVHKECTT